MRTLETVRHGGQVPYAPIDSGPRPLALKDLMPFLALPAPRVDPELEEVERRFGASQLGFQEAVINQMQSLTNHMSLMIQSQQPGPSPQDELGGMLPGYGVSNVDNMDSRVNFVELDRTTTKKTTMDYLNRTKGHRDKIDIIFVGGGMLRVNVGRMVIIMVVVTVEGSTP